MNTRNQEAWDSLRQERDDLLLAIDRCEETKTALHLNLRAMRDERDELAQQVEVMRSALQFYMDFGITEPLYYTVRDALALPNTAADILRQRDARVIRQFAAVLLQSRPPLILPFAERYANELERKNG